MQEKDVERTRENSKESDLDTVELENSTNPKPILKTNTSEQIQPTDASFTLSCCQLMVDSSKAGQLMCQPLEASCICFCICISYCFCVDFCANSDPLEQNLNSEESGASNSCVKMVGACIPRSAGRIMGSCFGIFRASYLKMTCNTNVQNPVCGYTREEVDKVVFC